MQTGRLTITIDQDERCRTIRATGELDANSGPGASAYLTRQIEDSPGCAWLFDLGGVEFMDSSGMHVLVMIRHSIEATGGTLRLLDVSLDLRKLLSVTGLDGHFETASTNLSAVRAAALVATPAPPVL